MSVFPFHYFSPFLSSTLCDNKLTPPSLPHLFPSHIIFSLPFFLHIALTLTNSPHSSALLSFLLVSFTPVFLHKVALSLPSFSPHGTDTPFLSPSPSPAEELCDHMAEGTKESCVPAATMCHEKLKPPKTLIQTSMNRCLTRSSRGYPRGG